jgi:peptide/nickel transport system substrate-binding protein
MFRNRWRPRLAQVTAAGAAGLLAVGIAACGGNRPSPSAAGPAAAAAVPGGTARVALPAGVRPDYIWPYTPSADANQYNTEGFQMLMYRPLYMFGDDGPSVAVNYPLSPADAPVYAASGKTVTITMKGWKWSDGETVDASDVIFWLNMMSAEPDGFYGHGPGLLPGNLASYRATGPDTVILYLKTPVSSLWFTYNQLAEITPMPAAWDVASPGAKAGSGGCATDTAADKWARCAAVYDFLSGQANNAKTYATNPIWGIVDGPWKLAGFALAPSGAVTAFTPNTAYSGRPKPRLSGFTYYAYTDDAAEYAALKAGHLDVGYIPSADLPPVSGGEVLPSASPVGRAYTLSAVYSYGIRYFQLNYANPALGPVYKQLYVRQALQELVDQEGMIASADRGYGYPTSGGVPAEPSSPWVPAVQNANGGAGPYPFSVSTATGLLTSHGWQSVGGVMTCESAGPGRGHCGAGIHAGTRLSMSMDYAAGTATAAAEAAIVKSDFAQAGIQLTLAPRPLNQASGESSPCRSTQPNCPWDMLDPGGWNFTGAGFEPTGEPLFATGARSNAGNYADPTMDSYINLTHTSDSLTTFQDYATYVADQLPFIWLPAGYSVAATSSKLAGVASSPLATLLPEYWYFTG